MQRRSTRSTKQNTSSEWRRAFIAVLCLYFQEEMSNSDKKKPPLQHSCFCRHCLLACNLFGFKTNVHGFGLDLTAIQLIYKVDMMLLLGVDTNITDVGISLELYLDLCNVLNVRVRRRRSAVMFIFRGAYRRPHLTFETFASFSSCWATLFSCGLLTKVIRALTACRMIQCAAPTQVMQISAFL